MITEKDMKVVFVSGSPRKGENSERIVNKGLGFFKDRGIEADSIMLSEVSVGPCVHCDYCKKNDSCSKDEKANEVNEILAGADAVIVATPVYFGTLSGQLKCFLDKTLPLRRHGFRLKGKVGAAIAVGGSRNGGQEYAIGNIHAWMLVHGMVIVGDNNHFGGTVHNPLEKDSAGEKTVEGTFAAVADLLERFKD